MPDQQSYPIGGHVYDNNRNIIAGATVYLINTTTQEQLASAYYATSNENGEYLVNAQNLSEYTDGDNYEVIATKAGYEETRVTGTISIGGGGENDKDIFMDVNLYPFKNDNVREQFMEGNYKGKISQYNRSFIVWANNKTTSGTAFVITSGGGGYGKGYTKAGIPVINLNANETAYIEQIIFGVRTDAKAANVEVVKCSDADGGGTATSVSGQIYVSRGTSTEYNPIPVKFAEPIKIPYSSFAKSVGIKTSGTDTSTYIDVMMIGYVLGGNK